MGGYLEKQGKQGESFLGRFKSLLSPLGKHLW